MIVNNMKKWTKSYWDVLGVTQWQAFKSLLDMQVFYNV